MVCLLKSITVLCAGRSYEEREPNTDDNLIPVRSKEATVIIGKLFGKAVAIFEECGVNMPSNERKMVKKTNWD